MAMKDLVTAFIPYNQSLPYTPRHRFFHGEYRNAIALLTQDLQYYKHTLTLYLTDTERQYHEQLIKDFLTPLIFIDIQKEIIPNGDINYVFMDFVDLMAANFPMYEILPHAFTASNISLILKLKDGPNHEALKKELRQQITQELRDSLYKEVRAELLERLSDGSYLEEL
jgi:hypothetical protein